MAHPTTPYVFHCPSCGAPVDRSRGSFLRCTGPAEKCLAWDSVWDESELVSIQYIIEQQAEGGAFYDGVTGEVLGMVLGHRPFSLFPHVRKHSPPDDLYAYRPPFSVALPQPLESLS